MNDGAKFKVKEPKEMSERAKWLRDYYFKGLNRKWNNEYSCFTTGTNWDIQYDEISYYIVPETYTFLQTFRSSILQEARPINISQLFIKL